ncbi:hypothetical protein [Streptomyces mangrovisoli]|uniref:Uncharacterized protein n=1 Tax=Streptomyces mangrovisoli TaxID=1428628 RepID=A0A1J4P4A3_9ACTN|nr:hypothetical protein [Streptomyces mangrovisoli]OIJ69601.1 hypothetical protein WN71_001605 [Streptomyces mangrovisoli]
MSLFSAPEGHLSRSAAVSPPPATNPFQAPDFGENSGDDESLWPEEADGPEPRRTRSKAA